MSQAYAIVGSLRLKHKYFKTGIFTNASILIDNQSDRMLQNFGMLVKIIPGGAHLVSNDPEKLKGLPADAKIRLYMHSTDPYYINYTALDGFNPATQLMYFNNLGRAASGGSISLQANDEVGPQDFVNYVAGQYRIPDGLDFEKLSFSYPHGEGLIDDQLRPIDEAKTRIVFPNVEEGLIELGLLGATQDRFYLNSEALWKKPVAVIEVYLSQLYQQYKSAGQALSLDLQFGVRQAIWRYYFVGPNFKDYQQLSILNGSKEPAFEPVGSEQVGSASEARVFQSKSSIAFEQEAKPKFQLVDQYDPALKSGKVIIKHLPNADPVNLIPIEDSNPQSYYLPIYVY